MKKIMFFRPMFYMGGTEIAILSLIKKLKNYEVYIGYTDNTSDKQLLKRYKQYAKVIKVTKETNVDTLIICSPYTSSIELSNIISREKTYLWFHHFGGREESVLSNIEYLNKIDKIIAVSEYTKNVMLSQPYSDLVEDKIEVIYNIIDSKDILSKSEEQFDLNLSSQLNIVSVSRLCYKKGFARKLALAKILKEKNIDFKWFIIGSSYYKEVEKEIKNSFSEFKDNFIFFGFLENPYSIIKQCDYLALLSDDETWGLVLTEAKILRVPCIVSDFEVAYEQIIDNSNGIILNRDDTASYETKIDAILNFKDTLKENLKDFKYSNYSTLKKWCKII